MVKKKMTKVEKEEREKPYNEITGERIMLSSAVNGNVIKSFYQNTCFDENEFGEIEMDLKILKLSFVALKNISATLA